MQKYQVAMFDDDIDGDGDFYFRCDSATQFEACAKHGGFDNASAMFQYLSYSFNDLQGRWFSFCGRRPLVEFKESWELIEYLDFDVDTGEIDGFTRSQTVRQIDNDI